MNLIQGDCIEKMKDINNNSIDLLFCDLPYGQTSCKWDCLIDLELFWKEVNRICKAECPMFFTCSTKFGVSLINSNPKNFRYDLVWVKSAPCGFLNAKKMPMRKHEMVYVFYRKLPTYNISSHKHKFIKERESVKAGEHIYGDNAKYDELKYDPPLPNSVIKTEELCKYDVNKNAYGGGKEGRIKISKKKQDHETKYDPPLPNSVITTEHKTAYGNNKHFHNTEQKNGESIYDPPLPNSLLEIKSERGKHSTQKPIALIEWFLKYYSKEGDTILDPTMGSGSTAIACKNMNRNFIGIEKDEKIFKIASERINLISS
jgi:DNA modification methylase